MIRLHSIESKIPNMAAGAVLIISGSSFLLSFFNLQSAALQAGINPWLSWLWPVCIDALLIAGSLMILRSNLRNEPVYVGWSVLLTSTAVSTLFNVIHSPEGIINQAAHAVPPIALCVSIELLMICVKSDLTMSDKEKPLTNIGQGFITSEDTKPVQKRNRRSSAGQIQQFFEQNPGSNSTEAADKLGLSKSTINRHLRVLGSVGIVHQEVQQ